jgi:hypothetical protein
MHRIYRVAVLSALVAVTAFGQDRSLWRTASEVDQGSRGSMVGTVTDISAGRDQFTIIPDADNNGSLLVTSDAISTQYSGFGGVINGKPEIYTGSTGFPNIRLGDRVEVRGIGSARAEMRADVVTLLGRTTPATQVGVGSTRPSGTVATPMSAPPTSATDPVGRVEGTVRQISPDDYRLVLETDERRMITVRGTSSTPVYFNGNTYRIRNIEVGDRLRVEPMSTSATNDLRARSIDVLQSVGDAPSTPTTNRSVAQITGRVTRVDRTNNVVRIDTGRGEVRIDLATAVDSSSRRVRASDVKVGDQLEVSGTYGTTSDLFLASTVTFDDDNVADGSGTSNTPLPGDRDQELVTVTIYGSVAESLKVAPQLTVRETQSGRAIRIWVLDDFAVRSRTGAYVAAETLKEGDNVTVKAYRDVNGDYIAQVIRIR